jgi:hypothetical protein
MADYVTSDTCEGNVALSPLLETKVESVVLDPLYASNTILLLISSFVSHHSSFTTSPQRTVVTRPPRWFATALAIDGFSATHSTFIMWMRCCDHRAQVLVIAEAKVWGVHVRARC